MARPSPTLASVAADLARLTAGERPAWVPAPLWRRVRAEVPMSAACVLVAPQQSARENA